MYGRGFLLKALIILFIQLTIRGCWCLECHICMGTKDSPCVIDPKSTQILDCKEPDSTKIAEGSYQYMYESTAPRNKTCIALLYTKRGGIQVAIRSCFPIFEDACEIFEETLIRQDRSFQSCRSCTIDYCNTGYSYVTLPKYNIISVISHLLLNRFIG